MSHTVEYFRFTDKRFGMSITVHFMEVLKYRLVKLNGNGKK
jgi:hypothetical protein